MNLRMLLLCLFLPAAFTSPAAAWDTQVYGAHALVATLDTTEVQESSGLATSHHSDTLFWTHNDSGAAGPRVHAVRMNAADRTAGVARSLGYASLAGASNIDWEDMSRGPGGRLYMFDGGDNPPCERTNKRIHRFVEPAVNENATGAVIPVAWESIRFEYPDSVNPALPADSDAERYDCECLMVHPTTGDIYLLTKRDTSDSGRALLFKLPAGAITWGSASAHVVQFVRDLSATIGVSGSLEYVTGRDTDGRRVVVRDYAGTAFEWTAAAGQNFDDMFATAPRMVSIGAWPAEWQGEAITYARNGGDLVTTSEVVTFGPVRMPIYVTPWRLANVRADQVRMNTATIRWDTATAAGSNVNYGPTTAYGSTVDDLAAVTVHEVPLAGLIPGTRYYYRIASGSLVHPQPAGAAGVFFDTLAYVRPDFDQDGDVDSDDFGHLQNCLSGAAVPQTDPGCADTLLDADGDVDADEVNAFRACMSGAMIAADPECE